MRSSNPHIIEMGMQIHYKKLTFVSPVPFLAQGGGRVSGLPKRVMKQLSSQGRPSRIEADSSKTFCRFTW
jgi:hypothetical protein